MQRDCAKHRCDVMVKKNTFMISHKDLFEGKANSGDENTAAELCSKYVFAIKPEIKEWLETGIFRQHSTKKVYQLLEIEHKIMDALNKLEDS